MLGIFKGPRLTPRPRHDASRPTAANPIAPAAAEKYELVRITSSILGLLTRKGSFSTAISTPADFTAVFYVFKRCLVRRLRFSLGLYSSS